jgi:hypothetical protein
MELGWKIYHRFLFTSVSVSAEGGGGFTNCLVSNVQ